MKTLTTSSHTLRNLIAGFTLSAFFFIGGTATAQEIKFVDNAPIHTQITDGLKVALFPVANSHIMRVHVENPAHEKVTVLIKNSKNEVVYQKQMGNEAILYGKFDVSHIDKGIYTMVIESANQSYANAFSVGSQPERIAKAF